MAVATKPTKEIPGAFPTIEDVMKILKVSESTIHGLVKRSKNPLPSVKIGKSRRFPYDKLRWWMENL